jgi:flavodoxin
MNALVIYGSRYGNTQKVAEAIRDGLGTAKVLSIEGVSPADLAEADLIVVGGPTEAHGISVPVKQFLAGLPHDAFKGKEAAAFDTRLAISRWLSGSAASGIAARLRGVSAHLVAPAESFEVKGKEPQLEPGELARAADWGRTLARIAASRFVEV